METKQDKATEKRVLETYYIDEDQMGRVTTYLPLMAKMEWVSLIAERCFDVMQINASFNGEQLDMPGMYKENTGNKSRYLMGALVRLYLHGSWEVGEGEDEWLMPVDEYDKWAGGHIFSQIEKFKSNAKLRDICFNLMNDYKDLERRLNTEIHGLLTAMNDPATRQMAAQQMAMSPEAIEKSINELNAARDALLEYQGTAKEWQKTEEDTEPKEK